MAWRRRRTGGPTGGPERRPAALLCSTLLYTFHDYMDKVLDDDDAEVRADVDARVEAMLLNARDVAHV